MSKRIGPQCQWLTFTYGTLYLSSCTDRLVLVTVESEGGRGVRHLVGSWIIKHNLNCAVTRPMSICVLKFIFVGSPTMRMMVLLPVEPERFMHTIACFWIASQLWSQFSRLQQGNCSELLFFIIIPVPSLWWRLQRAFCALPQIHLTFLSWTVLLV